MTAVPVAAFLISKLPSLGHKTFIGITCIIIGLMTFFKFFKL
jgi:hypothetical protein